MKILHILLLCLLLAFMVILVVFTPIYITCSTLNPWYLLLYLPLAAILVPIIDKVNVKIVELVIEIRKRNLIERGE